MGYDNGETGCNYEAMAGLYMILKVMVGMLVETVEKAEGLQTSFDEAYEGDAKEEVNMFLTSLPRHIERLALFYDKMADYIDMTAATFMTNDIRRAQNMEG